MRISDMDVLKALIVIALYLLIGYIIGAMYSYINEEDFDDNLCVVYMWPLSLIVGIGWCFLKLVQFIANKIVFMLILPIELIKANKKIKNMEDTLNKEDK
jgi:hypothetical protein